MIVFHEAKPRSSPGALDNPHYMAVCHIGLGPLGTLQEGARGLDPPACHDQPIY
jgi:hypothetical protein